MMKNFSLIICFLSLLMQPAMYGMIADLYSLGCANKITCGYKGAVDKSDPYCEKCELKKYPDRFVACLFCRKPLRQSVPAGLSSHCFECFESVKSLLVDRLLVRNVQESPWRNAQHEEALKMGIKGYLSWTRTGLSKKYIKAFRPANPHQDIFRPAKYALAKPHIYLGAKKGPNGGLLHIWTRELKIEPEDKKFILDAEEARRHVAYIFAKYNIGGTETGTIIEQEINSSMVTFEELSDTESQKAK